MNEPGDVNKTEETDDNTGGLIISVPSATEEKGNNLTYYFGERLTEGILFSHAIQRNLQS